MNVHEYQAKEIFRRFGIPTVKGGAALSAADAQRVADGLEAKVVVLKSQIHAGGRGKGRFKEHPDLGGVKVLKDKSQVKALAAQMLGSTLVTNQTGAEGTTVKQVFVESGCDIDHEFYAAVLLDRQSRAPVIMVSREGGMDIEEVAEHTPEKIFKEVVDVHYGLHGFQARRLAEKLGWTGSAFKQGSQLLCDLVRCFMETDSSLMEVNPLVTTSDGKVIALDAKINFDDNALFRHPETVKLRDTDEEDARERRASESDLSYISMDGNIGCMVNGAGLAMATMDVIKLHGGEPANFLDVGGGATAARVTEAFKIILDDPEVKAILVNIFGGIVRCDLIAEGVIEAAKTTDLGVPLIVRLEGNRVEEGKKLLAASGLDITTADDLADAAAKAVAAAKEVTR